MKLESITAEDVAAMEITVAEASEAGMGHLQSRAERAYAAGRCAASLKAAMDALPEGNAEVLRAATEEAQCLGFSDLKPAEQAFKMLRRREGILEFQTDLNDAVLAQDEARFEQLLTEAKQFGFSASELDEQECRERLQRSKAAAELEIQELLVNRSADLDAWRSMLAASNLPMASPLREVAKAVCAAMEASDDLHLADSDRESAKLESLHIGGRQALTELEACLCNTQWSGERANPNLVAAVVALREALEMAPTAAQSASSAQAPYGGMLDSALDPTPPGPIGAAPPLFCGAA